MWRYNRRIYRDVARRVPRWFEAHTLVIVSTYDVIMLTINSNIVYTKEKEWSSPRLSGVGIITDSVGAMVTVPLEADQRHDDVGLDPSALMDLWLLKDSFGRDIGLAGIPGIVPQPFWGFPFHESCWVLLGILHRPGELDVQALLGLCRSFPISSSLLGLGHDYGGIMEYFPKPEEHIPGEEYKISRKYIKQRYYPQNSSRDPIEYSDPLNIPSLQEIFHQRFKEVGGSDKKDNADEA